jgi:sulfonate transport system substrate-binding protein
VTRHRIILTAFALALPSLLIAATAARADAPSEIRLAFPQVGVGNRPTVGASVLATVHLQGRLEQEFKNDGIKITWTFLRGAGPAVNELYANGLVDFSLLGDLPSIVGRASGLKTRVLATSNVGSNSYLAVPADSNIQSVKDLRGRRVALFKGTAGQLTANKILAAHGLTEKDVRAINMDAATARAALITKDIDASFGTYEWLGLRDQGAVRIVYTTRDGAREATSNTLFLGSEAFLQKYPEIAQRVVKVFIETAKWVADQDRNPAPLLQLWTKSGQTFASLREDWKGQSFKDKLSPLVDPYVVSRYKSQIELAKKFGLVKNTFDFESWVDRSFQTRAIKELGLEGFWSTRGPEVPSSQRASATPATSAVEQATAQR